MPEFDKSAYDQAYIKEHVIRKMVPFNRERDAELLAAVDAIEEPFAAYVKRLIREDIARKAQANQ